MEFRMEKKRVFTTLALTGVFNTIIALFLTYLGFGGGLGINFIFSQAIGLCMCAFILAGHRLVKGPSIAAHLVLFLITMPAGAAVGTLIGAWISGLSLSKVLDSGPASFIQLLLIGVLFGTMITYFFFSRERISQTDAQLQEEQIRRLTLEKKTLETHLRLLQAQIEPHFLFNTLSNVLSLLESDPPAGRKMLVDLTGYLRASLSRSRSETTTLGQEMDLIRVYLDIQRVRMGDRLRYTLTVPETIRSLPFPPMLVQPLVENAVKHGLEPRIEGGEILVKAEEAGDCYRLVVADTGMGLQEEGAGGIGLANVRGRLEALFQGRARLMLQDNRPCGLKVTMEIPHG
ncbi:MAG: sensor histidine kinase [Deltaproteobacteria bacterium]|nr:sensor histidine kinase [Deltaproteobacteria bacterium]